VYKRQPNIVPITDYALNSKETDRERLIQYATNPPTLIHNRRGQKLIPSTSLSKGYVGQLKLIGQTDSSKTLDRAAKQKAASSALVKIQREETQFDENEKIVIKDAIEHVPDDYRSVDPDAFIHAGIVRHLKRLESMT